ncbi:MAG: DUF3336 domain-containing protein [Gammaproteobacteria bacterium]|nr:DUF3336 domain-containing protein [Gammaproteobacteria bacterium]
MSLFSTDPLKALETQLDNAANYGEWREIAERMDELDGAADWKAEEKSELYSWRLLRNRLNELRQLRANEDVRELVYWLHEGLHGNLGNMANPALYTHSRVGTKNIVTEYINEVADALQWICDNDFEELPFGEKMRFFKRTAKCFGRSGLLLSGGATLGMFHIGVCRALYEEGLMPRVISGSSAGSIIAGAICAHTDEEIPAFFDPEYLYLQAFRPHGVRSAIKNRSIMDSKQLSHCLQENIGDLSFEEGFERTGRILNVPISPVASNQMPRLMNYLTGPNVLIRTASLASCSIPAVFPPVRLLAKDVEGNIVPYLPTLKWSDGSLTSDLPMLRLARLHDVNHYIVSQVNPHVAPFMSKKKVKRRSGIWGMARGITRTTIEANTKEFLEVAKNSVDHPLAKRALGEAHKMLNQQYYGDVTVIPKFDPRLFAKVLSNPTPADISDFVDAGMRQTWTEMERMRNAVTISQTFESCIHKLKTQANQKPSGPEQKRAPQLRRVS